LTDVKKKGLTTLTSTERLAIAGRRLGWEVTELRRAAGRAVRGPGPDRDTGVQSCKAAGAAIAAWALTGWWLQAPMALLAPWTALTLVEATVYRSFRSGVQQLAVIMAGTLGASAAMAITGGSTLGAMLITLPIMMLLGSYRRLGAQGLYGATTALFVITYGAVSLSAVGHRLLETLIGAALGIAVNAFVLPPVHLRNVRDQLHRLPRDSATLLHTMAGALEGRWTASDAATWHNHARRLARIPAVVSEARRWTTEGSRANPGARLRRTGPPPPAVEHDARWESIASHLVAITRTLDSTTGDQVRLTVPGTAFLTRYAELAERAAVLCEAEGRLIQAGAEPEAPHRRHHGKDCHTEPEHRAQPQRSTAPDRPGRARDEVWRIHDRLVADFAESPGPAAAVCGELLVETTQMLSVLTSRETTTADETGPSPASGINGHHIPAHGPGTASGPAAQSHASAVS
jgi:hypothetical protein